MLNPSALRVRVLTALAVLIPVLTLIWTGGIALLLLALVFFAAINYEYYSCFVFRSGIRRVLLAAIACLPGAGYLLAGFSGIAAGCAAAVILLFSVLCLYMEREPHEYNLADVAAPALIGICYPGLLGSLLVAAADRAPRELIFWVLAVVVCTDTFAYLGGSAIGGVKLAPRISPNKTVSGTICGMAAGVGASVGLGWLFSLPPAALSMALYGLTAAVLAVFGDLSESLLKRTYNIKDTGTILPGHGGFLDRLDALLFAVPVVFLLEAQL